MECDGANLGCVVEFARGGDLEVDLSGCSCEKVHAFDQSWGNRLSRREVCYVPGEVGCGTAINYPLIREGRRIKFGCHGVDGEVTGCCGGCVS